MKAVLLALAFAGSFYAVPISLAGHQILETTFGAIADTLERINSR